MDFEEKYDTESSLQKKSKRRPRKIERDWTRNEVERLIQLIRREVFLWDPKHTSNRDRRLRERTFENIAQDLERNADDCKQKWGNLRAQFRGYRTRENQQKIGHPAVENYKVQWQFYKPMKFLIDLNETSPNADHNLSDDADSSSNSMFHSSVSKSIKERRLTVESEPNTDILGSPITIPTFGKQSDSAQIFGDYVADRLRQLKEIPGELLKEKITVLILQTLKAERKPK